MEHVLLVVPRVQGLRRKSGEPQEGPGDPNRKLELYMLEDRFRGAL